MKTQLLSKTIGFALAVAAIFSLAACDPANIVTRSTPPEGISPHAVEKTDLTFVLNIGTCFNDSYDSSSGLYTQDMGPDKPAAQVKIPLTEADLQAISQRATEIGFFDLPAEYAPAAAANLPPVPYIHNELTITSGGTSHSVSWGGAAMFDKSTQSVNLVGLYKLILDTIMAKPEYKTLPDRGMACA